MVSGRESRRAFHQPPTPPRLHEEVACRTPRVAQEVSTRIPRQTKGRPHMTVAKKKPEPKPAKKQAAKPKPQTKAEQPAKATEGFMPAILCAHTKLVPIESLKRHPRNPNTHPDSQIKLLANIIAKSGFRSPIVVSNRSGFITKGHGRLDASELLGMKFVPVDFQDYESDEAEMADMVADNQIASLAEMDRAVLKDILQELDTGAFDMLLTGFDTSAIEKMMTNMPPEGKEPLIPEMYGVMITAKTEDEQAELLERFMKEGLTCRAVQSY